MSLTYSEDDIAKVLQKYLP